jgi:hypothetical protein
MAHDHEAMGPAGPADPAGVDLSRGITRRSLLGAAATSVLAGSAVARMLQRAGSESLDGASLVVAQHELRTDHQRLRDLRRAQRADGAVDPFVLVGVTAPGGLPADEEHHAWIRTRGADGWSEWMPLVFTPWERPDADEAAGGPALASQALWVGWSDAVEIELPTGIDGTASVSLLRETPRLLGWHSNEVRASTTRAPQPVIRSRESWNARDFKGTPAIADELQMAIVHHTVNRNGYAASEVAGMIAAIQRYHQDTNGWNDIGYNFIVDRFGQVWDARAGGTHNAVIGGHAYGHNTGSTGISVLGDHQAQWPSAAAVEAVTALAAWKLDLHGCDIAPALTYASRATGRTKTYPHRIIFHGETADASTACPGQYLKRHMTGIKNDAHMRQLGLSDVPLGADLSVPNYLAAPVAWMVRAGITTGTGSPARFRPVDVVTRGQMALFLWRLMGEPVEVMPHGFLDVPPGSLYDAAVRWLAAEGITGGTSPGRFGPGDPVTRAQMVSFLHRLAGEPGDNPDHGFSDVPSDAYFEEPVRWAKANGITGGDADGRFDPSRGVTRGQTALFMHRLASRRSAWAVGATTPPAALF